MNKRPSVLDFDYDELQALLSSWGQPSFRAAQVWQWIYSSLASGWAQMTNLPKALRERLSRDAEFRQVSAIGEEVAVDNLTTKVLFKLGDGHMVEGVAMSQDDRRTACISTQVGCAVGCPICATGAMGFTRNLSAGEIADQVLFFARQLAAEGRRLTNVVFMGMGEPLHNFAASWRAIGNLSDPRGFAMSPRRMVVSTAGVVPGIRRLVQGRLPVGLAVSLHAPDDALRDELVPLNRAYPLRELVSACAEYTQATGRRITFEYALIQRVNDWPAQARAVADITRGMPRLVNLIPLNHTPDCSFLPSRPRRAQVFRRELDACGVPSTLRISRGTGILAGCGQLGTRMGSGTAHRTTVN